MREIIRQISNASLSPDEIATIRTKLNVTQKNYFSGSYNDLINKPFIPNLSNPPITKGRYLLRVNKGPNTNTSWTATDTLTQSEKNKLNSLTQGGANKSVQADWNESNPNSDAYIKNKPTFRNVQYNPDWAEKSSSSPSYIKKGSFPKKEEIAKLTWQAFATTDKTQSSINLLKNILSLSPHQISATAWANPTTSFFTNLTRNFNITKTSPHLSVSHSAIHLYESNTSRVITKGSFNHLQIANDKFYCLNSVNSGIHVYDKKGVKIDSETINFSVNNVPMAFQFFQSKLYVLFFNNTIRVWNIKASGTTYSLDPTEITSESLNFTQGSTWHSQDFHIEDQNNVYVLLSSDTSQTQQKIIHIKLTRPLQYHNPQEKYATYSYRTGERPIEKFFPLTPTYFLAFHFGNTLSTRSYKRPHTAGPSINLSPLESSSTTTTATCGLAKKGDIFYVLTKSNGRVIILPLHYHSLAQSI